MKLILGGPGFDREVFAREQRGNWSSAFPLVLEKWGRLDFEVLGPHALRDRAMLDGLECLLIGRLPDAIWTRELARRLLDRQAPTYVDGPLPRVLAELLGIRATPAKPFGSLAARSADILTRAKRLGAAPSGKIAPTVLKPVTRVADQDWEAIPEVPLTERQAGAWRVTGWDVETWTLADRKPEVLAKWVSAEGADTSPAIVRYGSLVVSAVRLTAFLGQMHTSEPAERGHRRSSHRVTGIETLLLALLDDIHARAHLETVRVLPWPDGARWALNVRHDFDRALPTSAVAAVLRGHERLGTAATWYWRSRHLRGTGLRRRFVRQSAGIEALRAVASAPRQEVAHHTERLWGGGDTEQRTIERALGRPVRGTSAHGDPNCFRFQGAPNVLWAERQHLLYTELIQHAHAHPHRFATLEADGTIHPLSPICLPHHESFDRSMTQGDTYAESVIVAADRFSAQQGLMQVMNHPDLHPDDLFAALARLPEERRLDVTAAEAADWWRRTHVHDVLSITRSHGGFAVSAAAPVEGLTVVVESPDGTAQTSVLSVDRGERRRL